MYYLSSLREREWWPHSEIYLWTEYIYDTHAYTLTHITNIHGKLYIGKIATIGWKEDQDRTN